jgi:AraC-like DNA-binding protein
MIYRLRVPRPPLSHFIENLWFYSGLDPDHSKEKLLPNAAVELIIDLTDWPKKLYEARDLRQPKSYRRCWISGMHRRFIVIGTDKGSSMMGAHFRTGGAAPFLGFPLTELTGNVVELDAIWRRDILALREQLLEAATIDAKFDLLEAFLFERARNRLEVDRTVGAALNALRRWPVLSLRQLASDLGTSQKGMIASFQRRVGVGPKFVGRLFRFQTALAAASAPDRDWAHVALDCGYYDQPHLIHEFQEFAGVTPAVYARTRSEFPDYIPVD